MQTSFYGVGDGSINESGPNILSKSSKRESSSSSIREKAARDAEGTELPSQGLSVVWWRIPCARFLVRFHGLSYHQVPYFGCPSDVTGLRYTWQHSARHAVPFKRCWRRQGQSSTKNVGSLVVGWPT
jgi:hypothetical protein